MLMLDSFTALGVPSTLQVLWLAFTGHVFKSGSSFCDEVKSKISKVPSLIQSYGRGTLSFGGTRTVGTEWRLDPLGNNRHGPKIGGLCPCLVGKLGPHLTQCSLGRGLPPHQVAFWSIWPFGHNRHGPKSEGLLCFFWRELGPHLTQYRLGWGLPSYQVASWSIQPFSHNTHGPEIGLGLCLFFGGGRAGSSSNTMWPGPRPASMPSGILLHPTVWPQYANVTDRTDR